jgi:hypothetical protein
MNTVKKLFLAAMFSVGMAAGYEPAAADVDLVDSKIFMASPLIGTFAGASARGLGFGAGYTVEYLILGGSGGCGGGGQASGEGGATSGGSGAGGAIDGIILVAPGSKFPVAVGTGGTGRAYNSRTRGGVGGDSIVTGIGTAKGGGGGGGAESTQRVGGDGGCGGGGVPLYPVGSQTSAGGNGTSGQGSAGGTGRTDAATYEASGGGGGVSGAGGDQNSCGSGAQYGGKGGPGLDWKSLGTYYGSGGPGVGAGPLTCGTSTGYRGVANSGDGVIGGHLYVQNAVNGNSGIVIFRYLGAQRGSGGTVTSAGGYTYHTFTGDGTFTA